MSPRIRQHVNPLKSDLLQIAVAPLEAVPGRSLEVELGSGEAHFLVERARAIPGSTFLGVEIRREMVERANDYCRKLAIANVQSVFANISQDLPRLLPRGSVDRFHLNFPDPWWKSRQRKRRVVAPGLAEDLYQALAPGGEVFVQTDIFEIALDAMATLEEESPRRFANRRGPWSFFPHNPYGAKSRRERQCDAEGTKIWRLLYCRSEP